MLVYCGNKLIKEIKKTYMVPSEMENIKIKVADFDDDIKLEVIDA